ncbi:hypothetical protein ABW21_db0209044 [Orbilia brochopaga]|nr:hypothetical protein ABW21_db0209044 [Drechslerella brochopaga]
MFHNATKSIGIRLAVIGTFMIITLLMLCFYWSNGGSFFMPSMEELDRFPSKEKLQDFEADLNQTTTVISKPEAPGPPGEPIASSRPMELSQSSRTVILGKTKSENTSWVKDKLPDWRPIIYSMDEPESTENFHVSVNKGREAMAYLTYLVDYYDDLSDINVFIHAHEEGYPQAWHNEFWKEEYSIVTMLQRLKLDNVYENGYVNLRCNGKPGCEPVKPQPATADPEDPEKSLERGLRKLWEHMYGNISLPEEVGVPCCAQFAVTRERIRQNTRELYIRAREWILWTGEEDPGRPLEYFWHIMFGMPPVL